jgi:uncharacterized protein (TIGR00369 family)
MLAQPQTSQPSAPVTDGQRSRTFTWHDPQSLAAIGRARSGLDVLAAIATGDVPAPPIASMVGIDLVRVESGVAIFALTPQEFHYNPIGAVHGGITATLLDSAMGCAVHTTLAEGSGYTTLELSVNFVRAVTIATGPVLAEGRVLHSGRKLATAEGRLIAQRDGSLLAHGTTTCLVFETD